MRVDLLIFFESIFAMNTAAEQDFKCARKTMLVNTGRPIKPIIGVDIESRAGVKRNRRVSKPALKIHLLRQIRTRMNPANYLPGIDPVDQVYCSQRLRGNAGKEF